MVLLVYAFLLSLLDPVHEDLVHALLQHVTLTGINISKIGTNKVVEDWFNSDIFSLAMQLGLIPAPAPASSPK